MQWIMHKQQDSKIIVSFEKATVNDCNSGVKNAILDVRNINVFMSLSRVNSFDSAINL